MANRIKEILTTLGAEFKEDGIYLDYYIGSYFNAVGEKVKDKLILTEQPPMSTDWNTLMAIWRLVKKRLTSAEHTSVHRVIDGFMSGDIAIAFEAISDLCKQLNK